MAGAGERARLIPAKELTGMEGLTAADPRAVGEFRLLARLGAGGMGQVFLATSPGGRMVAVKVIHPELARDLNFVRRFRAEVAAARRVSGMYTAPLVAAGVDDRPPWLATAFVPGPSLEEIVSRHGPLPVPALWRLAAGLADALRAIHATGLVHRDLKPANVLLAPDGPRVIDFGISRATADSRLTATGSVIGTPSYMSPEQVEGGAAEPASDVFSLGSVLAFAACGAAPFSASPGAASASVLYRIVHVSPDLSMVPDEVRDLVQACLAKDAAWRPDLGQVAARCAAAAEHLGLSPAAFWPADVARVIEAQQTVVAEQVAALPAPGADGGAGRVWAQTGPSGLGQLGPAGVTTPSRQGIQGFGPKAPATGPPAKPALNGVTRRRLLLGAGAGGTIAAVGAGAWIIGSRLSASTPPGAGHGRSTSGTSGGARAGGGSGPASQAWTFTTGNQVLSNPGAANGVVYVGSRDGNLYAVDAATGKQMWQSRQGWVAAAPEAVNGMVCVSTAEGVFSAIHAAGGQVAWQRQTGAPAPFRPNWAVDGDTVILPSATEPMTAYNVVTGSKGSTFGSPGQFDGGVIAAANGVLYAAQGSGALFAVRISTRAILWSRQVTSNAGGLFTSIVVGGGAVYLTDDSGTLYSLNAANGTDNWSYPAGGSQLSFPVISGGMVYVSNDKGTLRAITTAHGKQAWTYQIISSGEIGPAVNGGTLYASTGLSLQALDAKTGDASWSYTPPTAGALVSTPAVANGLVFVGSTNDNLYAIRA